MNKNAKPDFLDLFGKSQKQDTRFFNKNLVNVYEFYLCGEIESSDEYIQWFDIIRHSGDMDVIKFYINSYGGDVFTAIQFMRALKETSATVIMSVEGACMSAATMIFMCADQFEVSEHSMFMFHNYSGGTMGKGGEMLDQLQHERKWSERLLREVYEDFLSQDETASILDNKDIWMDGNEVIQRLEKKQKKQERSQAAQKKQKKVTKTVDTPED